MHFKGGHVGHVVHTVDDLITHSYPGMVKSKPAPAPVLAPVPKSSKHKAKTTPPPPPVEVTAVVEKVESSEVQSEDGLEK